MEKLRPGMWSVNLDGEFDDTIPILEGDQVVACVWPVVNNVACEDEISRQYASVIAAAPDLFDALDNAVATLETLMAWYGKQMPPADQVQRTRIIMQARQALNKAQPQEVRVA